MNNKANYIVLHVGANEVEDIDHLADRVERILESANGWALQARTMQDAQVIDPMKMVLMRKILGKLDERRAKRNRTAPDGSPFRQE